MFLFPKDGWVRHLRRAGRRVASSEDVELALGNRARAFPDARSSGEISGSARSIVAQFLVEHPNQSGEQPNVGLEKDSGMTKRATASVSDPTLGAHSNPDNFRFVITLRRPSTNGGSEEGAAALPQQQQDEQGGGGDGGVRKVTRRWSASDGPLFRGHPVPDAADSVNEVGEDGAQNLQPNADAEQHDNGLKYVHVYLDTMYYFGTSPYRTPKTRAGEVVGMVTRIFRWMQLTFFCLMGVWSVLESASQAKFNFLHFMAGEGLGLFVVYAFHMFCILTKTYGIYRLAFKADDTDKMLNEVESYGQEYGPRSDHLCKHWKWVIHGFNVLTLLLCAFYALFNGGFEDWSPQVVVHEKSYDFALTLYFWRYSHIADDTLKLAEEYARKVTGTTITFAIASVTLSYASDVLLGAIRVLVLLVVIVIFLFVMGLVKEMRETMENASPEDEEACQRLQARRELCWKRYRKLKAVISATNTVFDNLLQLLHVDNLLLYGFFANLCIGRVKTSLAEYLLYLFKIVKSELTYFLAGRISKQNDFVRKWLRNWASPNGKIQIDGKEHDVHFMLDELDKEPLGLGTGNFVIRQEFHFKFLGLVGSLVLFLAEENKKNQ